MNSGAITKANYYLTHGAGKKMYVLRYYENQKWWGGDKSGEYTRDYLIQNLSINYDKAVAKAKALVAGYNKNNGQSIDLYINDPVDLNKITQRDKDVIAAEKARKAEWEALKAKWAEEAEEREAQRNNNFVYACWANYMARSCKIFDTIRDGGCLQNGQLDTENRVTVKGKIKATKEYPNKFDYYGGTIYKAIIELDTGHTIFGSVPRFKEAGERYACRTEVGDVVEFDAKLEKPNDFDGTFYYYKRPTKVKLITAAA